MYKYDDEEEKIINDEKYFLKFYQNQITMTLTNKYSENIL